jgi:hypothetical protein
MRMLFFMLYRMQRTCKIRICRSFKHMIGEELGPYTIIEIVGTGGIGTVYKDEDPDSVMVALKPVRSKC